VGCGDFFTILSISIFNDYVGGDFYPGGDFFLVEFISLERFWM
jgi:hypothetical protein